MPDVELSVKERAALVDAELKYQASGRERIGDDMHDGTQDEHFGEVDQCARFGRGERSELSCNACSR